jgi:hypothetical protein
MAGYSIAQGRRNANQLDRKAYSSLKEAVVAEVTRTARWDETVISGPARSRGS